MLIQNGDGTATAGPFDVLLILEHDKTKRLHVCFAEERPFPGPIEDSPPLVRLKSAMHHTGGAATLGEALEQIAELRRALEVRDENVWTEPRPWDGDPFVVVVPNWRAA